MTGGRCTFLQDVLFIYLDTCFLILGSRETIDLCQELEYLCMKRHVVTCETCPLTCSIDATSDFGRRLAARSKQHANTNGHTLQLYHGIPRGES